MKKIVILISLFAWGTSLLAENITRKQAEVLVQNYIQNKAPQSIALYATLDALNEAGFAVTTSNGETFSTEYACWAYCLEESKPGQRRYLFVKEKGGSLLEVIVRNDFSELDASSWKTMEIESSLVETKINMQPLYPNPVGDWLILSYGENTRVEIYDLKGICLFSGLLSGGQLDVSFLSAGVYMVNVSGETGTANYKIIKN